MTATASSIVVAGGGTGGHIFPGLAVVAALRELAPEFDVHWVGSQRGRETDIITRHGVPLHTVAAARVMGTGLLDRLAGLLAIPVGTAQAVRLLRKLGTKAVLGVGGYASVPGGLAATLLGLPLVLQEQNARPGRANRLLGRRARCIALSIDEAGAYFPAGRCVVTGNPVRAAIVATMPLTVATAHRNVLVFGGSQGARFLNERVPALLASLAQTGLSLSVVHQTGPADELATRARYAECGLPAEVVSFIDDMGARYDAAHFVICRSGATTVAELQAAGRGALLVPFPFAADDHQAANAQALVTAGAAWMVRQENWNESALVTGLQCALEPKALTAMSRAALDRARPEAARAVADLVLRYARSEER